MPGGKKSPARGKKSPARGQGVKKRRMAVSQEPTIEHNERSEPSSLEESIFDPIGCYIPLKLKEKNWKGEFIDLSLLIKSPRELANFPDPDGDIVVKGGHMRVESLTSRAISNIHTWTSAFMLYMSVLHEKHDQSSLALKCMRDIRFAANKSHGLGTYDQQFRLRKAQKPQSSWAVINQDLWPFYITTAMRDQGQSNDNKVDTITQTEPLHSFLQPLGHENVQQARTCNASNTKGKRCNFNPCNFRYASSAYGVQHPVFFLKAALTCQNIATHFHLGFPQLI
ncbi:unnamed protein product [Mytilus coruscus]|uniref:Uncharacterized protein n=1 Tax=Mytilus coruscus TaxID=42192 RepID=A0A6J8BMQ8_MYTCO|nr:unnamed protein product [Mytilus coruscus]